MPRNVSGVFSLVPGTAAVTDEIIESADYNALTQDIAADLNTARPITAGGTGATTVGGALTNLGVGGTGLQLFNAGVPSDALKALRVPVLSKTANYKILAADIGSIINCNGTFTLDTDAAATVGAGFHVFLRNTGRLIVTIDPNSSETIDGATTLSFLGSQSMMLFSDGINWFAFNYTKNPIVSSWAWSTNTSAVDLKLPVGYSAFEITASRMTTSVNGEGVYVRLSIDDGATFAAGATDYLFEVIQSSTAGLSRNAGSGSFMQIANGVINTGNLPALARAILSPGSTAKAPSMVHDVGFFNTSTVLELRHYYQYCSAFGTAPANAIRFLGGTGNLTGGNIVIRGIPAF